jgi:hypothetical protein
MVLARVYDDWYWGDPLPNISVAIHRHCEALRRTQKRPLAAVRKAGALLALAHVRLDHDSDDAFLLLEHVLDDLAGVDDDRILARGHLPEMLAMLEKWRDDRGVPSNLDVLSPSEREIWDDVTRWSIEPASVLQPFWEKVERAKEALSDLAPEALAKVLGDAMRGYIIGMQDAAEAMTRDKALLADVRKRGHEVTRIRDLRQVPIEVLDQVSADTMLAGKLIAALEGAGAGAGGLIFMAADIPAVMHINLRNISQIAHTYGFETESQAEKAFVLNLLGAASADQVTKAGFMNNLNKIAMGAAKGTAWKELNEHAFVKFLQKIAETVGVRLTKKKLLQTIPIAGAAVGLGVNYGYTHDNLEAARMMYRKRWLIEKCARAASGAAGAAGPMPV